MAQALWKALRAMPAEGAAAMVEMLLEATKLPVSLLLRDLVKLVSEDMETGIENFAAIQAAFLYMLEAPGAKPDDLRFMAEHVCFPFFRKASPFSSKASRLLAEGVSAKSMWEYAASSLISPCLSSLSGGAEDEHFPLSVACQVVADLTTAAREAIRGDRDLQADLMIPETDVQAEYGTGTRELEAAKFCSTMAEAFWKPSLRLISQSLDESIRSVAMQTLLSSLLPISQMDPSRTLEDVWICCKEIFSSGPSQRRDAYRLLSMLKPFMNISPSKFDLRLEAQFWKELRAGLVNDDSLTRKRALHVLKFSLSSSPGRTYQADIEEPVKAAESTKLKRKTKRERWADEEEQFLTPELQRGCELSREWKGFFLIYDILEEYGIHLVEAAWKHQVNVLMDAIKQPASDQTTSSTFSFLWMAILFDRGLNHGNPTVRRMVLLSFLHLEWGDAIISEIVPESFALGSLLHSVNDPIQHRDFGVDGFHSSEAERKAGLFFQAYTRPMDFRSRVRFVTAFSRACTKLSLCRPGLMALASCMEASASGGACGDGLQSDGSELDFDELLENMRIIVEFSRQHFNANYRMKVCSHVLRAVQTLGSSSRLPFNRLSYFLASFSRDLIVHGGLLNGTLKFLLGTEELYGDDLREALSAFLKPPESKFISDDDIASWKNEANRWVRILVLGVDTTEKQVEIFKLVEDYAMEIYRRAYMPPTVSEKVLLLVQCLLRECPRSQEATKSGLQIYVFNFLQKFMAELRSHAEKCARVFSYYELSGPADVPAAVLGKLGGSSQRRLPPDAATVAIQGILALQTLSEYYIWLRKNRETCIDNCTGSFLWKISKTLSRPPQFVQEMRSEFYLASLEGLAHLCKVLPLVEVPEMNGNISEHDLDTLVKNIVQFSAEIFADGNLARIRLSALALYKWTCLNSLLSIQTQKQPLPASTLLLVFQDCSESLERAGEGYVLPLFQCLRWLLHRGVLDLQEDPVEVMWDLVRSGWNCIVDCNKRRAAPISAFLSAFLHPAAFSKPEMHRTDDKDGPLKWVLGMLLELGSRSPRTMRLTALHATRLWLKHPEITAFYIPELQQLTLYGGDGDEEVDGEVENEISPAEDADPELLEAFAHTEMFARVSVAVMVDKFAESAESGEQSDSYVAAATNCGRCLLLQLLTAASKERDLTKELYSRKSIVHRRKVRVWQMLCILSRFLEENLLDEVLSMLDECLYNNNMPSVRQYIEIFAIQLYLRFPHLVKNHLVPFLCDYNMKAQALSSYVFIAENVIRQTSPMEAQQRMIEDVLPAMLPHMTTHHHGLRTFSQVLIFQLCRDNNMRDQVGSKCLTALRSYLENNVDCTRVRQSVEEFLHTLDPVAASKPRGMFCERRVEPGKVVNTSKPEERPFECVPTTVVDKISGFLHDARDDLRASISSDSVVLSFGELQHASNDAEGDYQKKISPYDDSIDNFTSEVEYEADVLFSTIEKKGRELARTLQDRQDLIVVASLIDRIPNLAGLARTCEVFKAAALTLADKRVMEDRQFKLISVTADQWVPILEVVEAGLEQFLKNKKSEGYTVLGLEQTANSTAIHQNAFPQKTVLVLGKEKEGIPVDIIHLMDACLEIPQLGMIRSLNVHVSGAIAIWEYTRQHVKH